MINWILQKNLTKPETLTKIKDCLLADQIIFEEIEIIPFSTDLPEIKNPDRFNIVYGSTTFMVNAYKDKDYQKGVFYDPEKFQMKSYVKEWKKEVLNSDGKLIEFGTLGEFESEPTKEWFVRPNHDSKDFTGKVDTIENLRNWSDKICKLNLQDINSATEIWISEPKKIDREWRLFIVDDEIISCSRYMKNGELNESDVDIPVAMIDFAKQCIDMYRLADVYVMDVAEVNKKFKIIECNCFNGTGFYKHDVKKIIRAINDFVKTKIGN